MGNLTENFSEWEFTCKCGCGKNEVEMEFVELLQKIRNRAGIPMRINSACRCEEHNKAVKGAKNSAHVRCIAVDVEAKSTRARYYILEAAHYYGINRIGVARNFIHLDTDDTLPKDVFWLY